MAYRYTEAQQKFLRRKRAKEREEEKGCDCPGCDKCAGHVRNCTCDHDLGWLESRHANRREKGLVSDSDGGTVAAGSDLPPHINRTAFEEFGF